jgi:hypothetical protein
MEIWKSKDLKSESSTSLAGASLLDTLIVCSFFVVDDRHEEENKQRV